MITIQNDIRWDTDYLPCCLQALSTTTSKSCIVSSTLLFRLFFCAVFCLFINTFFKKTFLLFNHRQQSIENRSNIFFKGLYIYGSTNGRHERVEVRSQTISLYHLLLILVLELRPPSFVVHARAQFVALQRYSSSTDDSMFSHVSFRWSVLVRKMDKNNASDASVPMLSQFLFPSLPILTDQRQVCIWKA